MNDPYTDHAKISEVLSRIIEASGLELTVAVDIRPAGVPDLTIEFSGPDTGYLTARNGELLRALEHLAVELRGLPPDQHHLIFVDADRFTWTRNQRLVDLAGRAAAQVLQTGRAYTFRPMSSHERRQLHLALTHMGFRTDSTGVGSLRAVVVYPEPADSGPFTPQAPD